MTFVNYNGQIIPETQAPPLPEGSLFRFTGGIFESMLVVNNIVQLFDYHLDRLDKGIRYLPVRDPRPFDRMSIARELERTLAANPPAPYLKLRMLVFPEQGRLSWFMEPLPLRPEDTGWNKEGLVLGLCQAPLKDFDAAGNLKWMNHQLYAASSAFCRSNNWDDLLLLRGNTVVESGTSNIFWLKDGRLYTTPLKAGCIEGTMRRHILTSLRNSYDMEELELTRESMELADEIFLTNAVRRIRWVRQIEHTTYSCVLTYRIHSLLFP